MYIHSLKTILKLLFAVFRKQFLFQWNYKGFMLNFGKGVHLYQYLLTGPKRHCTLTPHSEDLAVGVTVKRNTGKYQLHTGDGPALLQNGGNKGCKELPLRSPRPEGKDPFQWN